MNTHCKKWSLCNKPLDRCYKNVHELRFLSHIWLIIYTLKAYFSAIFYKIVTYSLFFWRSILLLPRINVGLAHFFNFFFLGGGGGGGGGAGVDFEFQYFLFFC